MMGSCGECGASLKRTRRGGVLGVLCPSCKTWRQLRIAETPLSGLVILDDDQMTMFDLPEAVSA